MRIRTLLTTAAVSAALVAGGIAGPAQAANPDINVAPVITIGTGGFSIPALTETLPIAINTSAGPKTYLDLWIIGPNGVPIDASIVPTQDGLGNTSIDLISKLTLYASANYAPPVPGNYAFYVTSDATSSYDSATQTTTRYAAAQSATVPFTITKLTSKITGWKKLSKKAKYGKLIKLSSPTLHGVGPDTKIILQYRKKGSKTWKTSEASPTGSSFPAEFKLPTQAFNKIAGKRAKRGTYDIRVKIAASVYVTGAVSKASKVRWY